MGTGTSRSRDLIPLILMHGGEIIDLYAVFKGPHAYAPWQPREDYLMRNSPEAALHSAAVWGAGAYAAHCIQLWLPDGGEFRTPWEPFTDVNEIEKVV